jgi:hypothetical protein
VVQRGAQKWEWAGKGAHLVCQDLLALTMPDRRQKAGAAAAHAGKVGCVKGCLVVEQVL